jgi:hypothetical protein
MRGSQMGELFSRIKSQCLIEQKQSCGSAEKEKK